MKRLFWIGIILSCTTYAKAWNPPDGSTNFTTDARSVAISTTIASPTLLLSKDSFIQKNYIMYNSTCAISISTSSSGMSYATSAFIPGTGATTNPPIIWSPDGVNSPYWGALYGVSNCATPPTISIFRSK